MYTPNPLIIRNIVPARADNISLASTVSSIFRNNPNLLPPANVNSSTGSIGTFYFNSATGTNLTTQNFTLNSHTIDLGINSGLTLQQTGAIAIGIQAGQLNQGTNSISIGTTAGQYTQFYRAIAIGDMAGQTLQGEAAIAIGAESGCINQSAGAVAIGQYTGYSGQGVNSVAIGEEAAVYNQDDYSVAIGQYAGYENQGSRSVAIGDNAAWSNQSYNSVAIGPGAGSENQLFQSVAIGDNAAWSNQNPHCVAIGTSAGEVNQGLCSIAIGKIAGNINQSQYSISIGTLSGNTQQGESSVSVGAFCGSYYQNQNAIAIGTGAGQYTQGQDSIAIGGGAGRYEQGINSVAIGSGSGYVNQSPNSIAINGNGSVLSAPNSGFYVKPVRNLTATTQYILGYNSDYEIVQNTAIGSYVIGSTPFTVQADGNGQQIKIVGSNSNNQLMLGFDTTNNVGRIEAVTQGSTFRNIILQGANNPTQNFVGIGINPNYQLELAQNSAAKPTSNTWTISSDARLKENIVDADLDICYNVVKILPLRRFTWKKEFYPDGIQKDRNSVGFIANEVQAIYPKAVNVLEKQQFLVKRAETTEDNAEFVELKNVLNLDIDQIYKTMYGCIKKLIEKIEILEQKVKILENPI